jgi:hypothetical protein
MPPSDGSRLKDAKAWLRGFPFLLTAKRKVWGKFQRHESFVYGFDGTTNLNLVTRFPLYAPATSGSYEDKAEITIQTINQIFPLLSNFARVQREKHSDVRDIQKFTESSEDLQAADELKKFLDRYGSDKANVHNYHLLYGPLLKKRDRILRLLEIGIGTNNVQMLSNMGPGGRPGASLRAFRDFLTNAEIYGADIDKRILFEEEKIKTYYLDQTQFRSFEHLSTLIPAEFDLIIDDGLHSPSANINTLLFGLTKIKIGGWLVIEDIALDAIPVWELVAALLSANYTAQIFTAAGYMYEETQRKLSFSPRASAVFAVQRAPTSTGWRIG